MVGSTLGTPTDGAAPVAKTPRTPKAKTPAASSGENGDGSPKAKNSGRKRKADDLAKEESKEDGGIVTKSKDTSDPDEGGSDAAKPAEESPKKKAKAARFTAPRTPKSPKAPATPKTPKVSRTPKSTKSAKTNKTTQKSDAAGAEEKEPKVTGKGRFGSPEVQAKTDGTIKEIEGEYGVAVGKPEEQAVHDGFEKASASDEDD